MAALGLHLAVGAAESMCLNMMLRVGSDQLRGVRPLRQGPVEGSAETLKETKNTT